MSKYDPLLGFLLSQPGDRIPLSFAEIEKVLGVRLPDSKQYPAWWSNSPSNNPMTKIWLKAGYMTEQVDTVAERLTFRRAKASPPANAPVRSGSFPGFGAMKGTVRIPADLDLAEPADPRWGEVFE